MPATSLTSVDATVNTTGNAATTDISIFAGSDRQQNNKPRRISSLQNMFWTKTKQERCVGREKNVYVRILSAALESKLVRDYPSDERFK